MAGIFVLLAKVNNFLQILLDINPLVSYQFVILCHSV